jgi:hypothetical protein
LEFAVEGDFAKARLAIAVVGELCAPLTLQLTAVLHAMRPFVRHFGVIPNVSPLQADNFLSRCGQHAARHSNLVSHAVLSERSQFLNKLNALEEIVAELGDGVLEISRQLSSRSSSCTSPLWRYPNSSHFDLDTCLRETDVLQKSFLWCCPKISSPRSILRYPAWRVLAASMGVR